MKMRSDDSLRPIDVRWLGRTPFDQCLALQRQLVQERQGDRGSDVLLLTEHDHVYTIGTGGTEAHVLAEPDELRRLGIDVVPTDRGGDVTYHGPGQLVGYPILDLHQHYCDLHRYLRELEEVIIRTLRVFDVRGTRNPRYTGVWVDDDKICAIGIRTSRWITMHGFALNANTDLSYFKHIVPCGIADKGVTSMQRILGSAIDIHHIADVVAGQFTRVFGGNVPTLIVASQS